MDKGSGRTGIRKTTVGSRRPAQRTRIFSSEEQKRQIRIIILSVRSFEPKDVHPTGLHGAKHVQMLVQIFNRRETGQTSASQSKKELDKQQKRLRVSKYRGQVWMEKLWRRIEELPVVQCTMHQFTGWMGKALTTGNMELMPGILLGEVDNGIGEEIAGLTEADFVREGDGGKARGGGGRASEAAGRSAATTFVPRRQSAAGDGSGAGGVMGALHRRDPSAAAGGSSEHGGAGITGSPASGAPGSLPTPGTTSIAAGGATGEKNGGNGCLGSLADAAEAAQRAAENVRGRPAETGSRVALFVPGPPIVSSTAVAPARSAARGAQRDKVQVPSIGIGGVGGGMMGSGVQAGGGGDIMLELSRASGGMLPEQLGGGGSSMVNAEVSVFGNASNGDVLDEMAGTVPGSEGDSAQAALRAPARESAGLSTRTATRGSSSSESTLPPYAPEGASAARRMGSLVSLDGPYQARGDGAVDAGTALTASVLRRLERQDAGQGSSGSLAESLPSTGSRNPGQMRSGSALPGSHPSEGTVASTFSSSSRSGDTVTTRSSSGSRRGGTVSSRSSSSSRPSPSLPSAQLQAQKRSASPARAPIRPTDGGPSLSATDGKPGISAATQVASAPTRLVSLPPRSSTTTSRHGIAGASRIESEPAKYSDSSATNRNQNSGSGAARAKLQHLRPAHESGEGVPAVEVDAQQPEIGIGLAEGSADGSIPVRSGYSMGSGLAKAGEDIESSVDPAPQPATDAPPYSGENGSRGDTGTNERGMGKSEGGVGEKRRHDQLGDESDGAEAKRQRKD